MALDSSQKLAESFLARLIEKHGELMDSASLEALLRFGSNRSFRRAAAAGALPVRVFRIEGRSGWFARTEDVAVWLSSEGGSLGKTGGETPGT